MSTSSMAEVGASFATAAETTNTSVPHRSGTTGAVLSPSEIGQQREEQTLQQLTQPGFPPNNRQQTRAKTASANRTKTELASANRPTDFLVPELLLNQRDPYPPLPTGTLDVDPIPAAVKTHPLPLLRLLMPIVMIVMVIAMVGLIVLAGGVLNPMYMLFPLMMVMSMLMMFSPAAGEDVDETRRVYLRHLSALKDQALKNGSIQREHECLHHPDPKDLWSLIGSRRMWERAGEDEDALAIRLGTGDAALCTPVEVPHSGSPEDLDPVCMVILHHTVAAVSTVADIPIVLQLPAFKVIGIHGEKARDLAAAIIAQLAYHHGPEAVEIQAHGCGFEWVDWLPHTRPRVTKAMHRILVIDDSVHCDQELFDDSWTCIINVNHRADSLLGRWAEEEGLVLSAGELLRAHTESGAEVLGVPDCLTPGEALSFARQLSAYRRLAHSAGSSADLRKLLGIQEITAQVIESLWQPRGIRRLSVPIGVQQRGMGLSLDIKEAAHGGMGPHGLCVGATGSGKSELLRTLVLAMAATHSPEELNFVLVDFKGGATFLGLDALPHISAVITNLADESILVERMHDAISGEMNRRQELLRQAGNFVNVGEYTAARKQNSDLPALPTLFIVVDEFSELLGQHPDFADLFVAVGRLGRSLHIHLLLASQRLDEGRLRGLETHLSYRIGLKTFSAAESRQVLGVPDAYHLPNQPGVGYLKTSSQELIRFRASYVSGPLMVEHARSYSAQGVQLWQGWDDAEANTECERTPDPQGRTLVEVVAEATTEVARRYRQHAHPIWLPPLPESLPINEVAGNTNCEYGTHAKKPAGIALSAGDTGFLKAGIGIIDRPYHQRQDIFVVDFSGQGGHLAISGGPRSGKTMALRSTVVSLSAGHSPTQVRFYVLDLAGTSLKHLERLPHVAAVAGRTETEKVQRIIDEVSGLIDRPEQCHTFLIIDGWHVVAHDYEAALEQLERIAVDGLSANVHLVLSTPRWTTLRPAIRDLISQRIELKLGEPLDSLIDRKAQAALPARGGLGLTTAGEHMLVAMSTGQDIGHVCQLYSADEQAPKLKMLPAQLMLHQIPAGVGIALGIGGKDLGRIAWQPQSSPHILCLGNQGSGKSTFLRTIAAGITRYGRENARIVLIDHRRAHLAAVEETMLAAYAASTVQSEQVLNDTVITLRKRLPSADITPAQLKSRSWWSGPDIFVLIDDLDLVPEHLFHELVELIPHSRDIGLHLVLARKVGGVQRALYQKFLAAVKDQIPTVIILDADKDEGPLFGLRPGAQPCGRGVFIDRGINHGLCQIACSDAMEQELS
ncbi:type VII secretion protein EccCa [Corynebacterium kutscheri]|uniref:type VII secretion protein EccCa n=1 Tax=Corynebacterium kutscheri TaxID=35755 RepID=UPI001E6565AF|nr:type VII secretion protein EccCa [Corynebacterium kutscheri]